jgi:predicted peptidase
MMSKKPLVTFLLSLLAFLCGRGFSVGQEAKWQELFSKETYRSPSGGELLYRKLPPAKIEEGQKYPLVLFLHGAGERGNNNEAQLVHGTKDFAKRQATYPAFVIAPQCPSGKKWVEVDWSGDRHTTPEKPSESMAMCRELIDSLVKDLPIDTSRIYVTGLSMGGYGTFDAATRWPELFAAAAPVCGGGDDADSAIAKLKTVPLWIAHGDADRAVSVERSRAMVKALKAAGTEPHYVEMAKVGHDSWTATYSSDEFHKWLFGQQRQAAPANK